MSYSNPATAVVLILMGILLLGMGISKLVKHYTFMKKPHETIEGEIVGCEKEIHHYRLHTVTMCRTKLRFEHDGEVYEIMDENAIREEAYNSLYSGNLKCRIRITQGDVYTATLDYAELLNGGRNQGFLYAGIGAVVVIIGLI